MKLEYQELETDKGIWKILKRGDTICIVDPQGRERHRSHGHVNTAVYLAMQLNRFALELEENADEALRWSAEKFIEGIE